jgi:hypothetical protein
VPGPHSDSFEKTAAQSRDVGFLRELWGFLKSTRKWWLLPIIVVIVLFGLLVFLSGTGVAPFIYTLF